VEWNATRTVAEAERDAAQHEREVLRAGADEHLDERGVRPDEARVQRRPRQAHDRIDERAVRPVEARDDVHERLEPLADLGAGARGLVVERGVLDVELLDEGVVGLALALSHTAYKSREG